MSELPEVYKKFYNLHKRNQIPDLVGTDMTLDQEHLLEYARELLSECEVLDFLSKDDFVFMMHQGYIFWYFKLDGNEDPEVFSFNEQDKTVKNLGSFSNFIIRYRFKIAVQPPTKSSMTILRAFSLLFLIGCLFKLAIDYGQLTEGEGWGVVGMVGLIGFGALLFVIDIILRNVIRKRSVLNLLGLIIAILASVYIYYS